jgi:hypothetical protein
MRPQQRSESSLSRRIATKSLGLLEKAVDVFHDAVRGRLLFDGVHAWTRRLLVIV